ncbi:MAG: hypothetical protein EWV61_07475, partial [Microcystis aeruginosa Ma_AC_P_19900807_S300]
ICALSPFLYEFQLLLSLGTLIEFYFKLIICITIPEEPSFCWVSLGLWLGFLRSIQPTLVSLGQSNRR